MHRYFYELTMNGYPVSPCPQENRIPGAARQDTHEVPLDTLEKAHAFAGGA